MKSKPKKRGADTHSEHLKLHKRLVEHLSRAPHVGEMLKTTPSPTSVVVSDEEARELWHHIEHQYVDYKYTHLHALMDRIYKHVRNL